MKKLTFLFFIISLLFPVWSCSDDENKTEEKPDIKETLIVSSPQLLFKASGEKQNLLITSNTKWEIDENTETWYKINPMSGEGNTTLSVEANENTSTLELNAEIVIRTSTKEQTVKVKQGAAPPIEITPEGYYLPLLTINTENNKPITSKDYYLNATITIESRDEKGEIVEKLLETTTEIKGRGNSTWGMEKKPYRLKLNKSNEILGMPKNKHWVLLANYADKTLFRNELAFEISRRMGFAYTPRMQHVDVVLNGKYIGNYMLGEHIRIDKNRVNIPELEPGDTDITGGYLLEIDERMGEPEWYKTEMAEMIFCINRPEDIPVNQKEYIAGCIQNVENIIYGKDGINTMEELPKYLDMRSFIDYLLINEISKNVDGNLRLSTFVYKNRNDDKLYFGPVWDYDIAFGNVNYDNCDLTTGWSPRNAPWYQQLFSHPEFETMVKSRWKELYNGELAGLDTYIDELAEKMEISQKENFKRWPILNTAVWPNPVVTGSYKGEVDYLKNWLNKRMVWLNSQLN